MKIVVNLIFEFDYVLFNHSSLAGLVVVMVR